MAFLEIKKYPNPILRKKAQEVKEMTPEIKRLAFDMAETMKKNKGAGLAAPQVGELQRIIAVQTNEGAKIFINPEILKKSKETQINEEGCLSAPGLFFKIKRSKEVEVKALDENGSEINISASGLLATVFQHEIDHLNGVLFIDHLALPKKIWEIIKYRFKK
ncbi:MAG: peptide deformylase [Candidatus Pacebacteria bacterium]|nr:peptide deformylase [Candidatus Paceibacterota bacterium]